MNEKKLERFEKLFPWIDGFSMDLLFWIAIDTVFYTYAKHLSTVQIVSINSITMIGSLILQFPCIILIRKLGNTRCIRLSAFLMLISSLLITFGPSFAWMAAGAVIKETAYTFHNMMYVTLKNNLDLRGRAERYLPIRSKANTIYATVTMVISFIAGPMFNLNPYLPMAFCIFFCVMFCTFSFLLVDETEQEKKGAKAKNENQKSKLKLSSVIIFCLISYFVFMPLVNSGQADGKLFIQKTIADVLGESEQEQVVLLISAMLIFSRIVRMLANLFFEKMYKRMKDTVGVLLSVLLFSSVALMLVGYFLPINLYFRFAVMTIGYVLILFARDPFKVYSQSVLVEYAEPENLPILLTLMDVFRRLVRAAISLFFSTLLLTHPILLEMEILLGLTALEIIISVILFLVLNRKKQASFSNTV